VAASFFVFTGGTDPAEITFMPAESKKAKRERAARINSILAETYPDAKCALNFRNPFQLLVATILSAQCTDERVNMVTPTLFKHFPDAATMAEADQEELEQLIRTTGFFRNKAKSLRGMSQALVRDYKGKVPRTMEQLRPLPGVGRKTANVVLGNSFDVPGLTVDTHMSRVNQRLGLTRNTDPEKIERDLMELIPQPEWTLYSHRIIHHGRQICIARKPKCEICPLRELCEYYQKLTKSPAKTKKAGPA
jgi:endonuclease-3